MHGTHMHTSALVYAIVIHLKHTYICMLTDMRIIHACMHTCLYIYTHKKYAIFISPHQLISTKSLFLLFWTHFDNYIFIEEPCDTLFLNPYFISIHKDEAK